MYSVWSKNAKVCGITISFFLSIFTGLLIHEHYTRECEFGNFNRIKNKKNTKNTKTFG